MPAFRYWRINVTSTQRGFCCLADVKMRATIGGTNLIGSGTATASSDFGSPYLPAAAVDGSGSTFWHSTGVPAWWQYDFGTAVDVQHYELMPRNDGFAQSDAPLAWTLRGSDDPTFATFTTVDTRTAVAADWTTFVGRSFFVSGATLGARGAYQYWRIKLYNTPDMNMSVVTCLMRQVAGGSESAVGGTPFASSSLFGRVPADAFDASTATFWSGDGVGPHTLGYDFGSAIVVRELGLLMRADGGGVTLQPLLAWTLEASTNNVTWVLRDFRNSNSTDWAASVTRFFTIDADAYVPPATNFRRRFAGVIG
jgi:hypothetical protein